MALLVHIPSRGLWCPGVLRKTVTGKLIQLIFLLHLHWF